MQDTLTARYDSAAPAWADKIRALGYYDGYLGFLSAGGYRAEPGQRVIDIGAGTAGFAEAWTAIQGPNHAVTLLEPSARMAERGCARLAGRGVAATHAQHRLETFRSDTPFDVILAAHVIEHGDAPQMLRAMRQLSAPGGRLWLVVSKPHWCNSLIWLQWRHRTYRPETIEAMLREAGWQLEETYDFPTGPPSRTSHGYHCRAAT